MESPIICLSVLDEQSARQEELRELYLRWLSEQEVRLSDKEFEVPLRPRGDKANIDSCFL